MPGLWGIISEFPLPSGIDLSGIFQRTNGIHYICDSRSFNNAAFGRVSIDKFSEDKLFSVNDECLLCTEGIFFNLRDLYAEYSANSLADLLLMSRNDPTKILSRLRGNFSGFVYDGKKHRLLIFTDHLSAKPVYYFLDAKSKSLVFSSQMNALVAGMKEIGCTPVLDLEGAYQLLSFSYMLGSTTIVQGVKKIPPGYLLIYEDGNFTLQQYYSFPFKRIDETDEAAIIGELDRRFKIAVKREFQRDLEAGYTHLVTLSGGLDSRTTVAYAKKLGFSNITCFTFSESDYWDERVAKQICSDHGLEFLFYALDNGNFLIKHIDEIISSNGGLVFYTGSSHLYNCLQHLSNRHTGIIHTGLMGGGVCGAFLPHPLQQIIVPESYGARSTTFFLKIGPSIEKERERHPSVEFFKMYNRGINGNLNGYRMIEQFTEFSSPFLDIDFLEYVLNIPPDYRILERIYVKWINQAIPEFATYPWERFGLSPRYPLSFLVFYEALRKTVGKKILGDRHFSMNPTEYWWKTNAFLREKYHDLFTENINNIQQYPELLDDCRYLFEQGSFIEKSQVLTLLRAVDIFGIR